VRKKIQIFSLALFISTSLLVSGCGSNQVSPQESGSNEVSPQEKRNNYDWCLGWYYSKYGSNQEEKLARISCYGYLK
jgi:hypothetical protein